MFKGALKSVVDAAKLAGESPHTPTQNYPSPRTPSSSTPIANEKYTPRTRAALRTPQLRLQYNLGFIFSDGKSVPTYGAEDTVTTTRAQNTFVAEYTRGSPYFLDFREDQESLAEMTSVTEDTAQKVKERIDRFTGGDDQLSQWIQHNTTLNGFPATMNINITEAFARQGYQISPTQNLRLTNGSIYRDVDGEVTFCSKIVYQELVLMSSNGMGSKQAFPDSDDNCVAQQVFIIKARKQPDGSYLTELIADEFICYHLDLMPFVFNLVVNVFLYNQIKEFLNYFDANFENLVMKGVVEKFKKEIRNNAKQQDFLETLKKLITNIRANYAGLSQEQIKNIEIKINEVLRAVSFNIPLSKDFAIKTALSLPQEYRLKLIPAKFSLARFNNKWQLVFPLLVSAVNEPLDDLLSNQRFFLQRSKNELAIGVIHNIPTGKKVQPDNIQGLIIQPCYYQLIEENKLAEHYIGLLEQSIYFQFILRKKIPLFISLPKYGVYSMPSEKFIEFISHYLKKIDTESLNGYVRFLLLMNNVVARYHNDYLNNLSSEATFKTTFIEFYSSAYQCFLKYLAYEAKVVETLNEISVLDMFSSEAKINESIKKLEKLLTYRDEYLAQNKILTKIIYKDLSFSQIIQFFIEELANEVPILEKYKDLELLKLFSNIHKKSITEIDFAKLDEMSLLECHSSTIEIIAFVRIAYGHMLINDSTDKNLQSEVLPIIQKADADLKNPNRWKLCLSKLTALPALRDGILDMVKGKLATFFQPESDDLKSSIRQVLGMESQAHVTQPDANSKSGKIILS